MKDSSLSKGVGEQLQAGSGEESECLKVIPKHFSASLFLSDKRLRAALTTLFGVYEGKIFGAVVAIL